MNNLTMKFTVHQSTKVGDHASAESKLTRGLAAYSTPTRLFTTTIGCLVLILATTIGGLAQKPATDLTTSTLEDLMNLEVTSVSKKEEKLFQSAAAIYVITQEEIRRSGLTTIPDLLRRVPGLQVARIDGGKWAVSARGFNGRFTNKLLVLIDGRSVYTPEYSGVYWEAQDVLLDDVERIEVIRGPGGALWGANAVNGVINIITKDTRDTQGGLVTTGGGSELRGFGSVRYGGKLGDAAAYKVYAKYFNRHGLVDAAGNYANDGQQALRSGGRVDWDLNDHNLLSLEAEIFRTNIRETSIAISPAAPFAPGINTAGVFSGGHIMGRWTKTISQRSESALQVYYDRSNHDVHDLQRSINTFDVDFQHHLPLGKRQDFVWGLGYRAIADNYNGTSASPFQFTPKEKTVHLFSAFAQDEFTLIKDTLRLTLGTKLEHNDYTGLEVQPTARLLWTPSDHQTIWGAVSRAVRTPSRAERDVRINAAAFPVGSRSTAIIAFFGNEDTTSEELLSFELGYRVRPASKLSLDIATFYNSYDRLMTLVPGDSFFETQPTPPHFVISRRFANALRGETFGAEVAVAWRPTHFWNLNGAYSLLQMQLHIDSASPTDEQTEGRNPEHQFQFHSTLTLPRNFELDTSLYHVSSLVTNGVPSYTRLDARLGWRFTENVELSMAMQNLLDKQHPEFGGDLTGVLNREVPRGAYGKITWRF
jgi:iron complex outermembrane receptor protein